MDTHDTHRIVTGICADPFGFLGAHSDGDDVIIRAFMPHASSVEIFKRRGRKVMAVMDRIHENGLFEVRLRQKDLPAGYQFGVHYNEYFIRQEDPYRFGPAIGDLDIHLLSEGRHAHAYRILGAHPVVHEGISGTRFAVWAPSAKGVAVTGDFNQWNTVQHPMRTRGQSGIWELFIPGVEAGAAYKFAIRDADGHLLPLKSDPFALRAEMRPKTASIVHDLSAYKWSDKSWMNDRHLRHQINKPISIYEVHLGSWQRGEGNRFLTYDELADRLIPYVTELEFTHIELLPITEHPFDGSWGYQPIGLFAPTSRFGSPDDFKTFVDRFHQAGIGVILDWVPGHFPADEHGLAQFDGSHLYEHADPRKGFHPDWNTLIFNFGRREVVNYLLSSARLWCEEYHIDGLRVDAVASMLYLDYSRDADAWIPNAQGGNQNWEAVQFLQRLNAEMYGFSDGLLMIAEESTAWPGVTARTDQNGLGFGFKWNMGWMNDTLEYMSEDPINRQYHHHKMTFGIDYAFSENYVLPLSHDEVVHGKGSLLGRMPGDQWQKHANLRAYYAFMWGHPGKKLLFMGGEFGQSQEWKADFSLDWHLMDYPEHNAGRCLIRDLNAAYKTLPALSEQDCTAEGFRWIDGGAQADNVLAFLRWDKNRQRPVLVVCNFSPIPRAPYRIGVPMPGAWTERLNSDSQLYGGSGKGNLGGLMTDPVPAHGFDQSLDMTLPPLATLFFEFEPAS